MEKIQKQSCSFLNLGIYSYLSSDLIIRNYDVTYIEKIPLKFDYIRRIPYVLLHLEGNLDVFN